MKRDCQCKRAKHRHGTNEAYNSDRCGCQPCRKAHSVDRQRRLRRNPPPSKPRVRPPEIIRDCQCPYAGHVHGTNQAYNSDDCRCNPCRDAHNAYEDVRRRALAYGTYRPSLIPSVGTTRRLQALAHVGWSMSELSRRLGYESARLQRFTGRSQTSLVTRGLAAKVSALYDELWNAAPPQATRAQRKSMTYAQNVAKRRGWAPPLAWNDTTIEDPEAKPQFGRRRKDDKIVDEIAVELLMQGKPVAAMPAERREAVARLTERGMSAKAISLLLRRSSRSIGRNRATIRKQREDAA